MTDERRGSEFRLPAIAAGHRGRPCLVAPRLPINLDSVLCSEAGAQKTVIVTGASQGIGAGLVKRFLALGYNVVANSRHVTKSGLFDPSDKQLRFGERTTATMCLSQDLVSFCQACFGGKLCHA